MKEIKYFSQHFLLIISVCSFITNSYGQEYFPLEIGNRWDFAGYTYCHGGTESYDTLFIEVIGDTILNGETYFILSNPGLFFGLNYLRIENDSLYCFDTEDSVHCFVFAFNHTLGTIYNSCRYDSVAFAAEHSETYFGYPDTQQVHFAYLYFDWYLYEFSKKFGQTFLEYLVAGGICDVQYTLSGCIISGITYGQLLVPVEDQKLKLPSFKLEQNYPNPFNPVTSIQYIVGCQQFITLKVYDILGREVATLVNEEKPAGEYEAESDATGLASGVYFYQLKAGNYIETKKMVLMK